MISVVVPSYRRAASLRECLRSLALQTTSPEEIVVVLRRGDAESGHVVGECGVPHVVMVFTDRPGVLAAMQLGIRSCTGEVVAFIDDDAVAPPDWLSRLCTRMQDGVGAVGGRDRVALQDGRPKFDVGRVTNWGKLVGNHHLGAGNVRDVDHLKGVNMAVKREVVAIPEGLKGDGAQRHFEVATSLYVQQAGWRVLYDPEIVVDHHLAERHDNDARDGPDGAAVRAASYNLVLCLLSFRRDLFARRALYGLLIGDRGAPGIVRGIVAATMREPNIVRAVLPSLCGQLEALREIHRGRRVRMFQPPGADE